MALDQSGLFEVLEALTVADVEDRIRQAATTIYQALIEAELSSVIAPSRAVIAGWLTPNDPASPSSLRRRQCGFDSVMLP